MDSPERFSDRCHSLRGYLLAVARSENGRDFQARFDPDDAVQQALLNALRRRESFRGESDSELRSWLRVILINLLNDWQRYYGRAMRATNRSARNSSGESTSNLIAQIKSKDSTPSHRASREEQVQLVLYAITRLPFEQRRVVELRYLEGESLVTIAMRLGKTKASIAGLLIRAIRSLRSDLERST